MIEGGDRLDLDAYGVDEGRLVPPEELDSHRSVRGAVYGLPHFPHGACAEPGSESVGA